MIQLRTFGSLEIRGADGVVVTAVMAQPKRAALLVYLAVTGPRQFHRRDSLLALFWPELDEKHGRWALSQCLRFLRSSLGEDVLPGRGSEEIGIDGERLSCDVWQFDAALDRCDYAAAMALYAGDLLSGFHTDADADFAQWLDQERTVRRRRAAAACADLARHAATTREVSLAREWADRAQSLAPDDEEQARRLMRWFIDAGDRAGALRIYDRCVRYLRSDLGVEPAGETESIGAAVHDECGNTPASDSPALAAAAEARRPSVLNSPALPPLRPRRLMVAATALVAVVMAAGGVWLWRREVSTLKPRRVVVASFANRTGDTLFDPLGEIAADWIARGIAATDIADVAGTSAQLSRVPGAQRTPTGAAPLSVNELARRAGAEIVISGVIDRGPQGLVLSADVADATRDRLMLSIGPVTTSRERPMAALETLRRRVLGALALRLEGRDLPWYAGGRAPEYESYREFVLGTADFFLDQEQAIKHFERAYALDSSYAVPLIQWAAVEINMHNDSIADSLLAIAQRRRAELNASEASILDYLVGRFDARARYAAARAGMIAAPRSRSGRGVFAQAAVDLDRPAEAARIYEQLQAEAASTPLTPLGPPFYRFLADAYHALGRYPDELSLMRRGCALFPGYGALAARYARVLAATGRLTELDSALSARLATSRSEFTARPDLFDLKTLGTLYELRTHGHEEHVSVAGARILAALDLDVPVTRDDSLAHGLARASTLLAMHRYAEAQRVADSLAAARPDSAEERGLAGLSAGLAGDTAAARESWMKLMALERPRDGKLAAIWRARIAAALGDRQRAMQDLIIHDDSVGIGRSRHHDDILYELLRDFPAFVDHMKPKG